MLDRTMYGRVYNTYDGEDFENDFVNRDAIVEIRATATE